MKEENGNLFWISFADLMTALFIVALALFVLSFQLFNLREDDLHAAEEALRLRSAELDRQSKSLDDLRARVVHLDKQAAAIKVLKQKLNDEELLAASLIEQLNDERKRLAVLEEEYKKLQEIQKAIENLDPRFFVYQPDYKRHVLRPQVQFPTGSSQIAASYKPMLVQAGRALRQLSYRLKPEDNIKYLLVIEGMSSKDDYHRNYELSYERALALFRLWKEEGIYFDPQRFEVMISGSGEGGVGRDPKNEANNQRFLIQIIPKIGELTTIRYADEGYNFVNDFSALLGER